MFSSSGVVGVEGDSSDAGELGLTMAALKLPVTPAPPY